MTVKLKLQMPLCKQQSMTSLQNSSIIPIGFYILSPLLTFLTKFAMIKFMQLLHKQISVTSSLLLLIFPRLMDQQTKSISGPANVACTQNSLIQKTSCNATTMDLTIGVIHTSFSMKNVASAILGMFGLKMYKMITPTQHEDLSFINV